MQGLDRVLLLQSQMLLSLGRSDGTRSQVWTAVHDAASEARLDAGVAEQALQRRQQQLHEDPLL